jgi:Domain of unknown function (DUF3885)
MSDLNRQQQLESVFGSAALEHALFYGHEKSLRFELSAGEPPYKYMKMFMRAMQRATEISQYIFKHSKRIQVVLALYGSGGMLNRLSYFREFKECGITIPKNVEVWTRTTDNEQPRMYLCFDLPDMTVIPYLWGVLAKELGIKPRMKADVYLADTDTGVLLHPYDDRGMDLIGPNTELIKQAYFHFNHYLLEHDLQRMDQWFLTSSSQAASSSASSSAAPLPR